MTNPKQDMQLLYDVEYGVRRELILRLVGVSIGAVLMHLYDGLWSPFVWCFGYLLSHAVHYHFVTNHIERAQPKDLRIAGGLYLVVVAAFLWLPTWLAMHQDPVYVYVGGTLMTSTMVYQIRRADRLLWLNWAQLLIFFGLTSLVLFSHLPRFEGALGKAGAVIVTLAAFAYITLAMLYSRKSRLAMEEAAERLAQDQKMSAIGRLSGGIAHDFNNILTVIKGNLELYHYMETEEERGAAVAEAQMAAARAEAVVQHLLVYARKAPMQARVVDANEALETAMTLVRSVVPAHVSKTFAAHPGPLQIEVDEAQLVTALLNLVKNAVDAMPRQGQLIVRTGLSQFAEATRTAGGVILPAGDYVVVSVEDSGEGIDMENISKVVEPFFTTKGPGQGTGLGLSMVTGFVQGAGGGLLIQSKPGQTEVTLLFPTLTKPSADHHPTKNAAPEDGVLVS